MNPKFNDVISSFASSTDVVFGEGKGFGSNALKRGGKIFAMMSSSRQFVVKISRNRVEEEVGSGRGSFFEPRPGRRMKEWLVVAVDSDWVTLAHEAYEHVTLK